MSKPALLEQIFQTIKLPFWFPLVDFQPNQGHATELNYEEIQKKDILTLDEAALYIRTDPETLLEEVSLGHIPGGQLAGRWLFYKWALTQRFAGYQQPDHFEEDDASDNFLDQIPQVCDAKIVSQLLNDYALGERNFSGIDLSWAAMKGVSLPKIDFVEAILQGIDLRESNLQGAELMDAVFEGAKLSGADLSNANLEGANLAHADLSQALLVSANLKGVNLTGANLSGALLQSAVF